jgi:hypothetical protein
VALSTAILDVLAAIAGLLSGQIVNEAMMNQIEAIDGDSASKSSGSVYSVSYYRPAAGHREQLEKMLSEAPNDTSAGNVLMQHLEGGPWTFLTIARYNSWDDFATGEKTSVAQTTKKDSPWSRMRDHTDFHTDTLTDRISP